MKDLWEYLGTTDKKIVMYGMGNGADKILERLTERGIEVSDFFASDGFVRGHFFHGKQVKSFSQIKEEYNNFIILLSFASKLDDVLSIIYDIDEHYEMYAPDVPVTGKGTFDYEFFNKNKSAINEARNLLYDEKSKEVFDGIIKYKLTGKINYLRKIECEKQEIMQNILSDNYKTIVDAGAYNGDTVKEYIQDFPSVEKIYAIEPDSRNFKKLCSFSETDNRITPLNYAAWDKKETLFFDKSGNRNSNAFSIFGKVAEVNAKTIDEICGCEADFIKYDVEGAEEKAVDGSRSTIINSTPDLLVSLYHRNEDLFTLPLKIHSIYPEYKFYLRKLKYVPAWDLNLYAIKK